MTVDQSTGQTRRVAATFAAVRHRIPRLRIATGFAPEATFYNSGPRAG
jgi:hypothetical protein